MSHASLPGFSNHILPFLLDAFGFSISARSVTPFGSGLINHTWKVTTPEGDFILQRINHAVFKDPGAIAFNLEEIGQYLNEVHPEYLFTRPMSTADGRNLIYLPEGGYFRLFAFVSGSHSIDVVETADQAYEAAKQFGRFTRLLTGFDARKLRTTIPDFHNITLRFEQFKDALKNGNPERIKEAAALTRRLLSHTDIVDTYERIRSSPAFRIRVTHHDTKISNVLFDEQDKGLCVIDLDTVMPGYFISDVGDMMRTYLSPVSEEEKDFSKIEVREEMFTAIVNGYSEEMSDHLSEEERGQFFYAGGFLIYMQALRFLTSYLNNDAYYGSAYPGQNRIRTENQLVLLERLLEKRRII
jgi:Ser/Thr protein kinase RdoA (MazF antagonist)